MIKIVTNPIKSTKPSVAGSRAISSLWESSQQMMQLRASHVDEINNSYLNILDIVGSNAKSATLKIATISDMLSDLLVINGKSNTSINPLNEKMSLVQNVEAIQDLGILQLEPSLISKHSIVDVSVSGRDLIYGNKEESGIRQYADINNLISDKTHFEISTIDSNLVCSVVVDLGSAYPINVVKFRLKNLGVRLPKLDSLDTSMDGRTFTSQSIHLSNNNSIDLDEFKFNKSGDISLTFNEVRARYIRLKFTQNSGYKLSSRQTRYPISINGLMTGFLSAKGNGSIIFGPIKLGSEIKKVALEATVLRYANNNVRFFISHDGIDWTQIVNSKHYDPKSKLSKSIAYNTAFDSVQTSNSIKQIFLKVEIDFLDASYLITSENTIRKVRETLNENNTIIHIDNPGDTEPKVFKCINKVFGASLSSKQEPQFDISNIIEIRDGNNLTSSDAIGSKPLAFQLMHEKAFIKYDHIPYLELNHDSDPSKVRLYKFTLPIQANEQIETTSGHYKFDNSLPVLDTNASHGIYTIQCGDSIKHIDLTHGVIYSSYQMQVIVDPMATYSHVKVFDPIGRYIKDVEVKQYGDVKFISLFDIFQISLPETDNYTFAIDYPIKPLDNNQFGMGYGKFIFNKYFKGKVSFKKINLERGTFEFSSNINGSYRFSLENPKIIKAKYTLNDFDLTNTVKLKHTKIINGSLTFDISNASINSFIDEVPFQNGKDEFRVLSKNLKSYELRLNKIYLDKNFIDDGSIEFLSQQYLFNNRVYSEYELIDEGDWMIDFSEPIPFIRLPEMIFTSDIVGLEIFFSIQADKTSINGLYSVDYMNGIIHTTAPVDSKIIVEYLYSNMFAEYEALQYLKKNEYTYSDNTIEVLNQDSSDTEYVVIMESEKQPNLEYRSSPIISDLKINLITREDFI